VQGLRQDISQRLQRVKELRATITSAVSSGRINTRLRDQVREYVALEPNDLAAKQLLSQLDHLDHKQEAENRKHRQRQERVQAEQLKSVCEQVRVLLARRHIGAALDLLETYAWRDEDRSTVHDLLTAAYSRCTKAVPRLKRRNIFLVAFGVGIALLCIYYVVALQYNIALPIRDELMLGPIIWLLGWWTWGLCSHSRYSLDGCFERIEAIAAKHGVSSADHSKIGTTDAEPLSEAT